MKINKKLICVLAFLLIPMWAVSGERMGDCEITNWGAVVGGISSDLVGICEYEVDDWSSPSYLELDIQPLIESSPQIHNFQFYCDMSEMDLNSPAGFRPFEILTGTGHSVMVVDFNWNPKLAFPNRALNIKARCTDVGQAQLSLSFGQAVLSESLDGFFIQLSWKPDSGRGVGDGWVELFVNGEFAGRQSGFSFVQNHDWRPAKVRFGSTRTPTSPPLGVFRIGPINPAPYAFHL